MGRHRRLAGAVLMLGAGSLLLAGRSHGQRGGTSSAPVVIAVSVPAPPETRPVPTLCDDGLRPQLRWYSPIVRHRRPALFNKRRSSPMLPARLRRAAAPAFLPGSRPPANGLMNGSAPPAGDPPPTTPASTPTPPSSPPTGTGTDTLISVNVVGPARIALGQSLTHEIVVRNTGMRAAAEVHVEEPLPAGLPVLHTDPPAQTQENRLTWNLGTLDAGAERRLRVELQPGDAKDLDLRPRVTFLTGTGLRTQIIRPQFAVEMTANPSTTTCGGAIAFKIRLSNQGQTLIRNIKLYDYLPAGLHHPAANVPAGGVVGITRFGDLKPGESRELPLETNAVAAGRFANELLAQADSGIEARARVDVVVTDPTLALRFEGPKQSLTQRDLDFFLEVANPGPVTAAKIRLVQALPPSFEFIAASTGGVHDAVQHTLTWDLGDLAANQRQRVTFKIKASTAGEWPLYTAVQAEHIPVNRVANVLRIEGAPSLTLDVPAREELAAVGEEVVYEIHVVNQGDAPCTDVRLSVVLPDAVTPLSTQGPTTGQIQQQQVVFPPLGQLDPRCDAVYSIRIRAHQPGQGTITVALTAQRERPVQSETSIHVGGPAREQNPKPPGADGLR